MNWDSQQPKIIKAVSACIVHEKNFVMIQRAQNLGKLLWSFPGGKIEWGETPEEAVVREVFEETGAEMHVHSSLGTFEIAVEATSYMPAHRYEITCFLALLTSPPENLKSGSDAAAVKLFAFEDLRRLKCTPHVFEICERVYKAL